MVSGVGMASVRSDKNYTGDSFGPVVLCSIGSILSALLLAVCSSPDSASYTPASLTDIATTRNAFREFTAAVPHYVGEVAVAHPKARKT